MNGTWAPNIGPPRRTGFEDQKRKKVCYLLFVNHIGKVAIFVLKMAFLLVFKVNVIKQSIFEFSIVESGFYISASGWVQALNQERRLATKECTKNYATS